LTFAKAIIPPRSISPKRIRRARNFQNGNGIAQVARQYDAAISIVTAAALDPA
jgi:hypothetical protein